MAGVKAARRSVPVIRSKDDHNKALARIERIIELDDPSLDPELEALTLLVEAYEARHFPIEDPDPIEVLKFRMSQLNLNTTELADLLRIGRGRASELLNRKRRLTLELIRVIHQQMHISPNLLVDEYDLQQNGPKDTAHG